MIKPTKNVEKKSEDTSTSLRERSVISYGVPESEAESGKERLARDTAKAVEYVSSTLVGDEEAPIVKVIRLGKR